MANHASAQKRARQNVRRNLRNRIIRSEMKTTIATLAKAIQSKDKKQAQSALIDTMSVMDKAVKRHVIHAKNGSRRIGQWSQKVSAL